MDSRWMAPVTAQVIMIFGDSATFLRLDMLSKRKQDLN